MTLSICGNTYLEIKQPVEYCPTCEQPRRMLYRLRAWLGPDWTCLSCGERFCEEGRMERPFAPAWRRRNIEEARSFWERHGRKRLSMREVLAE